MNGFQGETMAGRIWHWTIHGVPRPQLRPRAMRFGKGVRVYDPPQNQDWKHTIQGQLIADRPQAPLSGPLMISLDFAMPKPKGASKKQLMWHVKKPDVDNLAKSVKDAMKGIVFEDDSQVVRLEVKKAYADSPGVLIRVCQITPLEIPKHGG